MLNLVFFVRLSPLPHTKFLATTLTGIPLSTDEWNKFLFALVKQFV